MRASRLKLRAQPAPDAEVKGMLELNQPVERLSREGEFARVRALNGAEGWVADAYLHEERLSWEAAVEAARAAEDAHEALVHWQRAAALSPRDRGTMRGLAHTYRLVGEEALADKVEATLQRPEALWVPMRSPPGQVWVPWAYAPWMPDTPSWLTGAQGRFDEGRFLDVQALTDLGYPPPRAEQWWVLPAEGPAVQAEARGVGALVGNECDATIWLITVLTHSLPEGTPVVAAWAGEPPASWREDAGAARRPSAEEAMRRGRAAMPELPEAAGCRSWPAGEARELRCDWLDGPPSRGESDVERWATRAATVGPEAVEVGELGHYEVSWSDEGRGGTQVERDVDGDGRIDSAGDDGCVAWIGDALWSVRTETTCCGC
ncbi:MAG: SH3 domain-containing protein [Alphaproteobacteria bacterium]|nr:SH3 domain-containing protein [Alphaproteobacteria bacterium]